MPDPIYTKVDDSTIQVDVTNTTTVAVADIQFKRQNLITRQANAQKELDDVTAQIADIDNTLNQASKAGVADATIAIEVNSGVKVAPVVTTVLP